MQEIINLVLGHIKGTWRYRWYAILVAWLVSLAGWFYVQSLPDVYRTSARVMVNTDTMLNPFLDGLAIQADPKAKVDMMTQALLTRPNLEKLVRDTDLSLRAKNDDDIGANPDDALKNLISKLRATIKIATNRLKENEYTISYSDTEPHTSHQVVKAMLDLLIGNNLGAEFRESDSAQRFIEEQIQAYEARLILSLIHI